MGFLFFIGEVTPAQSAYFQNLRTAAAGRRPGGQMRLRAPLYYQGQNVGGGEEKIGFLLPGRERLHPRYESDKSGALPTPGPQETA